MLLFPWQIMYLTRKRGIFMKKRIIKIISVSSLILLITATVGCGSKTTATKPANETTKSETAKDKKAKTKDFKSPDNKVQITIPDNWTQLDELKQINPKVSIPVGNKAAEKYAVVVSTSKENFSEKITLDQCYETVAKYLKQTITNAEISEVKDAEINGRKAKTFVIKGEINNIKVSYVYAIVDSPKAFHEVSTWTLTTKFDESKDELTKVVTSFKEL